MKKIYVMNVKIFAICLIHNVLSVIKNIVYYIQFLIVVLKLKQHFFIDILMKKLNKLFEIIFYIKYKQ